MGGCRDRHISQTLESNVFTGQSNPNRNYKEMARNQPESDDWQETRACFDSPDGLSQSACLGRDQRHQDWTQNLDGPKPNAHERKMIELQSDRVTKGLSNFDLAAKSDNLRHVQRHTRPQSFNYEKTYYDSNGNLIVGLNTNDGPTAGSNSRPMTADSTTGRRITPSEIKAQDLRGQFSFA